MRSDRTRKDTAKRYIAVLALLLFCSIVFYVQTHYQRTTQPGRRTIIGAGYRSFIAA